MRFLCTALAAFFIACTAQADWQEYTTVGVQDDNAKAPHAFYFSTVTGAGPASGQWVTIDLSSTGIPEDTKAVFLAGLLVITHGSSSEICNLTIGFRSPTSTYDPNGGNYLGQAIEAAIGGGQRSPMSTWVPVYNRQIQVRWDKGTPGSYPSHCAYGGNFSLQAYIR